MTDSKLLRGHPRVSISPAIMGGSPCIKGTRIPVYVVLDNLEAGHSFEEILKHYPTLAREDVQAAVRFGSHLASRLVHADRP